MSVLGLSGQAEITPSLGADGSLILTITSTRMSGNTLGVDVGTGQDSMLSYVGLDSPQITIPANSLPSGLRPTSAIVTNDGLRLSLAGEPGEPRPALIPGRPSHDDSSHISFKVARIQ